ncbi:phosphoglycolate phosphatase [Larsenimonas rhizosphaerae]|uniref:phosphoglycolate phosphatase n=1 Tax=Larsenimonas rhizosphaerae TaxID=2944682 RepID=UPI0020341645|nr:phosphoglycolate phosphatase [Larsenimonas rhizosphaerae]MCM2131143.1 phosphoglycolate phosphatase [Larsenimonas rhizosphaerae]
MHEVLEGITLIAYDLDGTLIDSVPDLTFALQETMSERHLPVPREEAVRQWVGNGSLVLVERALGAASDQGLMAPPDKALVDALHERFLHHYGRYACRATRVYPGVHECLAAQKARNLTQVLVTNKPSRFIAPLLEGLQLGGYFTLLIGGDSLLHKKPDPLPLLHVMEQVGARPGQTLMVGDSVHDVRAGQSAGCRTLGVPYGYNHGQPIADAGPDVIVESLIELV